MILKETQSCLCWARNCFLIQKSWLINTLEPRSKVWIAQVLACTKVAAKPWWFSCYNKDQLCCYVSSYWVRTIEMGVFGLLRRNSQSNFFFHLHALSCENQVCVWSDFATFAHVVKIEITLFCFESIKLFPLCKGNHWEAPPCLCVWYLKHVSVLV